MKISVVIPTYNEEKTIGSCLDDLCSEHSPDEIIVVDGGSMDRTVAVAGGRANVMVTAKGRAKQMNAGARRASSDILLFLHADTRLPEEGLVKIKNAISRGIHAGRFRMRFDESRLLLRLYSYYTKFHFFSYGDQGFFVKKDLFDLLGGFREDVPFEDIDFYKRLTRLTKPAIIREPVVTSARRFSQVGLIRQKMINFWLVTLYNLGINIFWLKAKFYREVR